MSRATAENALCSNVPYVRAQGALEADPYPPAPSCSRAARWCYFLLGAGLLAAWNALITATDYFQAVFPGWHMDRLFTVCYLPVCMAMLLMGLRFPDLPPPVVRIRIGYVGFTAAMGAVPLLDALLVASADTTAPAPAGALAAVLAAVVLVGACDGLCQGALYGEAAQLPPPYTHALVSGTASSGLLVCLLRVASKASFETAAAAVDGGEEDPAVRLAGLRYGTRLYFALGGLLSLSCLLVYDMVLPRLRDSPWRNRSQAAAASAAFDGEEAIPSGGGKAAARAVGELERQPLLPPPLSAPSPPLPRERSLELSPTHQCNGGGGGGGGSDGGGGGGRPGVRTYAASGGGGDAESSGEGGHGAEAAGAGGAPSPPLLPAAGLAGGLAADVGGGGGGCTRDTALPSQAAAAAAGKAAMAAGALPYACSAEPPPLRRCSSRAPGWAAALFGPQVWRCMALSWPLCGALLAVYTATLAIFPGFLAEDVHSATLGDWYPILLITAFNAADLVGKSLPCLGPLPPQQQQPSPPRGSRQTERQGWERQGWKRQGWKRQGRPHSPQRQASDPADQDVEQQGLTSSGSPGQTDDDLLDPPNPDHHSATPLLSAAAVQDVPPRPGLRGLGGGTSGGAGGGRRAGVRRRLLTSCSRAFLAALAAPLRRPGGLLLTSVLRGAVALPAFVVADAAGAPAAVMALLTALLGVSNGYLTVQLLTMGPAIVLQPSDPAAGPGPTLTTSETAAEGCWPVAAHPPHLSQPPHPPYPAAPPGHQPHAVHPDAEVLENLLVISLVAGLNLGAYLGWLWLL